MAPRSRRSRRQRQRASRGSGREKSCESLRGRVPQARSLHSRRFRRRAQTIPHHEAAQADAHAAHLSSARLRPQTRHRHGTHRDQRLHRLQTRKRKADSHPPDVSRQTRRRRHLHQRRPVVRHIPERLIPRRPSRGRRSRGPGRSGERHNRRRLNPHQATRSFQRS